MSIKKDFIRRQKCNSCPPRGQAGWAYERLPEWRLRWLGCSLNECWQPNQRRHIKGGDSSAAEGHTKRPSEEGAARALLGLLQSV